MVSSQSVVGNRKPKLFSQLNELYGSVRTVRCADIIIGAKQTQGWRLEQPEPGVLAWRTPAGRTYTTPTQYAI